MKKLLTICFILIHTWSLASNNDQAPWYIIQISDPQLGFIEKNKSIEQETILLKKAIQKINSLQPEILVITGDFVNSSHNIEQIKKFKELCHLISHEILLYKVPGNHDIGNSCNKENVDFYNAQYGEDHFSILHKGVQLIGINSCLIKNDAPQQKHQLQWLHKELKQKCKIEQRIIFGHHPFFLSNISEKESYSNMPIKIRTIYNALFLKYHVSHYFAGHLHNNATAENNGIKYITTSALGKQLGNARSGIRIIQIKNKKISHLYVPIEDIPASQTELDQLFNNLFNHTY